MDIPLDHLQRLIAEYRIAFRPGDILFIRSGFTAAFTALDSAGQEEIGKRKRADFIGVESNLAMLQWIWDNKFAAVAGDTVAFERSPPGAGKTDADPKPSVTLHEFLLGGWGTPIGELFDLEDLAAHCNKIGRWTFFLSSVPLKVCDNKLKLAC